MGRNFDDRPPAAVRDEHRDEVGDHVAGSAAAGNRHSDTDRLHEGGS